MSYESPAINRRTFLGAAAVTAVTAGVAPAVATAQNDPLGGWMDDARNYDGIVDRTGEDEVRVDVGASEGFSFSPSAIRIDPGTTVVWEWTGDGGSHDVTAEDGSFESELIDEAGHTFEHTFDEEGAFRYACSPHVGMGMKGRIAVGDVDASAAGGATGRENVPMIPGVAASLAIIGAVTYAVSRWAGAGRDRARVVR